MATNQNPAAGPSFLHRLFGQQAPAQQGQVQQAQAPQQGNASGLPGAQSEQFNGYQNMNLGQPAGVQNPNPEGNNPAAQYQQQMQQGNTAASSPSGQPAQGQQAPGQVAQQSPVDELSALLNNNNQQQSAATPDFFAISPEQLQSISGRAAYGASVPNEMMQQFAQDPVATLPKILDHVTTSMMRDVVPMLAKMTQAGTTHMSQQLRTELPQSIGRQQAVEGIVQKNPMMKPFADMIVSKLQQANPTMSASEIQGKAGNMLQSFIDQAAMNQNQQQQQQQQQSNPNSATAETIDWGSLLS